MRGFATYHPAVQFLFFVLAVVLTVLVSDPLVQITSLVLSASFYICIRKSRSWKVLFGLLILILVLAAINPLFNPRGESILFTWWGGRPYTFESLVFGISTSLMFASVLLWFFCYNHIMTSDKFTYLFGGLAPALTLVLTMVLRLIPTYQRKASEISNARSCIGHSVNQGSLKSRLLSGSSLLSALVGWALEGSIITADSMRSRGYGVGKRTTFMKHRFSIRDAVLLLIICALASVSIVSVVSGALAMDYFPSITFSPITLIGVLGFASFALLMSIPTIMFVSEEISWHISLSKI